MDTRPIGLFDSGFGGLSVLRQITKILPQEEIIFFADQAHVPYGNRTLLNVRELSLEITRYLLQLDAKTIIVACNTASAAALHYLRRVYPDTPFVGMEPAVKPAAKSSNSRIVGVLATSATFQGELFASVVERFASDVTVLQQTLPGLVERIEAGDLDGMVTRRILKNAVEPLLAEGIDTLVLACTHYPFIIPVLEDIVGKDVNVIDPSPAIARQTERILDQHGLNAPSIRKGRVTYISSADSQRLREMGVNLIGTDGKVQSVQWSGKTLK
jgi:glutamate racemase